MGMIMSERTHPGTFALPFALCLLPFPGFPPAARRRPRSRCGGSPCPPGRRFSRSKAQPFTATVPVTGTLVSRALVVVKAEVIGRLLKFPKQEGDAVTAGEAVAWVDDENLPADGAAGPERPFRWRRPPWPEPRRGRTHDLRTGARAKPDQVRRHHGPGSEDGRGGPARRAWRRWRWPRRNWPRRAPSWTGAEKRLRDTVIRVSHRRRDRAEIREPGGLRRGPHAVVLHRGQPAAGTGEPGAVHRTRRRSARGSASPSR